MARRATAKSVGLSGAALIAAMGGADAVESQQYLKGEILLEGISQENYTDGNGDENDRSNQMWMRTRFGLKVELLQQVETQVTLVYDAEGGDAGPQANNADSRAEIEINDAYVLLKGFLNDKLFIRAGRQPANYNLRSGHGAFLLDSRSRTSATARRPVVTGWDGLAAWWQSESWKFNLLYYIQDERNESSGLQTPTGIASQGNDIMGAFIDWKPDTDGDERMFITGSWTLERNPYVNDPATGVVHGEELQTFYLGGTFKLRHGFDLFAEGAFQDGDLGGGIGFDGFGISGGLVWRPPGERDSALTLQYDHLSGDKDPLDGDFSAFVNTWEGVSDTYIVEHERYGELSELMVGNLVALKAKAEWGFIGNRFITRLVAAHYTFEEDVGGVDDFGMEFDLELDFHYNDFTRITAFGAAFLPDDGYKAVAASVLGTDASDDEILLVGLSTQVLF